MAAVADSPVPASNSSLAVTIFHHSSPLRFATELSEFRYLVAHVLAGISECSPTFVVLAPDVSEFTISLHSNILPASAIRLLKIDTLIRAFEEDHKWQCVFQVNDVWRRHKRLAVFDMDSTLIQQEVIDEIAATLGLKEQIAAITERAMNGELDFEASLRERCSLLKGVKSSVWEDIKPRISLTPGVEELIRALKRLGYKTAVLSGGFMPLATWIAGRLGLDYVHANNLVISEDGASLTGELVGEIVHAERKREHVLAIAEKEGILLSQTVTVGDGANDLPMMGVAGLGVAFNAKPKVQAAAPAKLNRASLFDLMFVLGFSDSERTTLIQ